MLTVIYQGCDDTLIQIDEPIWSFIDTKWRHRAKSSSWRSIFNLDLVSLAVIFEPNFMFLFLVLVVKPCFKQKIKRMAATSVTYYCVKSSEHIISHWSQALEVKHIEIVSWQTLSCQQILYRCQKIRHSVILRWNRWLTPLSYTLCMYSKCSYEVWKVILVTNVVV